MRVRALLRPVKRWVYSNFYQNARRSSSGNSAETFVTFRLPGGKTYVLSVNAVNRDDYHTSVAAHGGQDAAWRLLINWIRPGEVMFDLGSNIGVFAIPAAVMGANVHAFELLPANILHLIRAAEKNSLKNFSIVQGALSDADGFAGIAGFSAWGATVADALLRIPTVVVDKYIEARNITRVDVMKIDIEGSERAALAGARRLIDRDHPDIVIEANVLTCGQNGYSYKELLRTLQGHGYRIYRITNDMLCPYDDRSMQEVIVADYLATTKSETEVAGRSILKLGRLSDNDLITNIEEQLVHGDVHRQYILTVLPHLPNTVSTAPAMKKLMVRISSVQQDERIMQMLATGTAR